MPGRRSDNHDYRQCYYDDPDCPRFPCRVYREGREHGYRDGHQRGHAEGHAEGYTEGHAAGYAQGYPDGMAACPLPHGGG